MGLKQGSNVCSCKWSIHSETLLAMYKQVFCKKSIEIFIGGYFDVTYGSCIERQRASLNVCLCPMWKVNKVTNKSTKKSLHNVRVFTMKTPFGVICTLFLLLIKVA